MLGGEAGDGGEGGAGKNDTAANEEGDGSICSSPAPAKEVAKVAGEVEEEYFCVLY